MKEITVLNPAAGKGKAVKNREGYITTGVGDCRRYVKEECAKNPDAHFWIVGGDGTLNEAISGILDAGAGGSASVTVVPCGSGNDTVKTTGQYQKGETIRVDVIRVNDEYGINMLNIGFDCNVVSSAAHFKNKYKIAGKLSYILGVMKEFFHHFGEPFRITAECVNGEIYKFDGEAMLCAICNGQWCGGSFHNSPLSDITDGELEMLLVRKMGRIAFLKMIGKYKKGTLIDRKTDQVIPKMQKYIVYKKIKKLTISGCKKICSDGEISDCTMAQISVMRGAVNYKV